MKKSMNPFLYFICLVVVVYAFVFFAGSMGVGQWFKPYHFILIPIFFILQIVIHEVGHGVFGKLTGHKLVSFRLFSHLWTWTDGDKVSYFRFAVPGILAQCLMSPPPYNECNYPFKLYLLGGILANLFSSMIVLIFFGFSSGVSFAFALAGTLLGVMNLLPQGANDGMTLYLTWNDTDYQYLLFLQLEINYQLISGKRYRELPVSYFDPLPFYGPRNYLSDFHLFIRYTRHLDQFEFGQALEIIDKLWEEHGSSSSPYQVDLAKELFFV